MSDPTRYSRFPQVGGFYAMREPLSLAQVTYAGDFADTVNLSAWTPTSNSVELIYLGLKAEQADYLWFNQKYSLDQLTQIPVDLNAITGDVWLTVTPDHLWFVGPDTNAYTLHVLATFVPTPECLVGSRLYQPGAKRNLSTQSLTDYVLTKPHSRGKTSFERIVEDPVHD